MARVRSEDLPHRAFEDSPFRVLLDRYPHYLLGGSDFRTNALYAARRRDSLCAVSTWIPMAQMKPSSSRPTAVTTTPLFLPLASNFRYRSCNRCCAFQAISLTSSLTFSCRLRKAAPTPGRCRYVHAASTTTRRKCALPVLGILPRRRRSAMESSLATIPP